MHWLLAAQPDAADYGLAGAVAVPIIGAVVWLLKWAFARVDKAEAESRRIAAAAMGDVFPALANAAAALQATKEQRAAEAEHWRQVEAVLLDVKVLLGETRRVLDRRDR